MRRKVREHNMSRRLNSAKGSRMPTGSVCLNQISHKKEVTLGFILFTYIMNSKIAQQIEKLSREREREHKSVTLLL